MLSNLKRSLEMLNNITEDEDKLTLEEHKKQTYKFLRKSQRSPNEEVKSLCAKIRVKYDELIEDVA